MNNFFSIIIPTYNQGSTINQVINILLASQFHDFEIIIIDDGSTDEIGYALSEYKKESRIQYYKQKNGGVSLARNTGVAKATGRYLLFLDSDDLPSLSILSDFYELMKDKPNCLLAFSQMDHHGIVKGLKNNRYVFNMPTSVIPGTYCVDRILFLEVGGFDTDLTHSENWELILRLGHSKQLSASNIQSLHKITLSYTAQYSREKLLFYKKKKVSSYAALYRKHRSNSVYSKNLVASFAQTTANNYAGLGNFYGTIVWTLKSVRANPLNFSNFYKPTLIFIKRRLMPYRKA